MALEKFCAVTRPGNYQSTINMREINNSDDNGQAQAALAPATCSVESASRQVIEHKLLAALSDESCVAILATKSDLQDIISACHQTALRLNGASPTERFKSLEADMKQLMREAFPPNDGAMPRRD